MSGGTLSLDKAPKRLPVGWISKDQYRVMYGDEELAQVPQDSWGKHGHPDALSPREWARVRGKKGI